MTASPRRLYRKTCAHCGTDFAPWDSLQRFCSQACFGASRVLPALTCERCGRPRNRKHGNRRFCSRSCAAEAVRGPQNRCSICAVDIGPRASACNVHRHTAKRSQRERKCRQCGSGFIPFDSQLRRSAGVYCSRDCYNAARAPRLAFITVSCRLCSKEFRRTQAAVKRVKNAFCSKRCAEVWNSGERNASYRGGERHRRGPGWTRNRQLARERDKVCRLCGKTPEENRQALSVDHIVPWRTFEDEVAANDLSNLVSLCRPCHAKKTMRAERKWIVGDVLDFKRYLEQLGMKSLVEPAA